MSTAAWIDDLEARIADRVGERHARSPRSLTVLFDPACALCRRCKAWMLTQPTYVPIEFLACSGAEARARFGDIPWLADELIVVGDGGEVWVGPAGFLTCLWALTAWREWSYRLASPAFAPLAERFFHFVSSQRGAFAALFDHECRDGHCSVGR